MDSTPRWRMLSGDRSVRALSDERRCGGPFSLPYGRYGSTGMRSSSGVVSHPPTQYSMMRGGLHNIGISVLLIML